MGGFSHHMAEDVVMRDLSLFVTSFRGSKKHQPLECLLGSQFHIELSFEGSSNARVSHGVDITNFGPPLLVGGTVEELDGPVERGVEIGNGKLELKTS